jgi:hypothetical protein
MLLRVSSTVTPVATHPGRSGDHALRLFGDCSIRIVKSISCVCVNLLGSAAFGQLRIRRPNRITNHDTDSLRVLYAVWMPRATLTRPVTAFDPNRDEREEYLELFGDQE